jgi:hypothetical protein
MRAFPGENNEEVQVYFRGFARFGLEQVCDGTEAGPGAERKSKRQPSA